MKINREDFLRTLEAVTPGLAKGKQTLEDRKNYLFIPDQVLTFNEERCCRAPTDLGDSVTGVINSASLLDVLRKMPDEEINVRQKNSQLYIRGKGRTLRLSVSDNITIPVAELKLPKKWKVISEDFCDAVHLVYPCVGTGKESNENKDSLPCIHVHPDYVEACNMEQLCRYNVATQISESMLIRGDSLIHVTALSATKIAEDDHWIHFQNDLGYTLSCRRNIGKFSDLSSLFDIQGEKVQIPKELEAITDRASILTREFAIDTHVSVTISSSQIEVVGEGVSGTYTEIGKVQYQGPPIHFTIVPEVLKSIAKRYSECYVTETHLRVDGGNWKYVTLLGNRQEPEDEESFEEDS